MTVEQSILEKREGACLTLTLNRPECRNALSLDLAIALKERLLELREDASLRLIVLRGQNNCFSAGGDLKAFYADLEGAPQRFSDISQQLNECAQLIQQMPQLIIAAVQGPAYAAALGLAFSCDLIFASATANFSPSFAKIALAPNASTTYHLTRVLGPKKAMQAFIEARVFSAKEAEALGLINEVWLDSSFEQQLGAWIEAYLKKPDTTMTRIKKLVYSSQELDFTEQLECERAHISASAADPNFIEGVSSFVEKRKPKFNESK